MVEERGKWTAYCRVEITRFCLAADPATLPLCFRFYFTISGAFVSTQQDYHVKIEGVEGESKHAKFKGWIDAISWTYGIQQPSAMESGGGGGAGKAAFDALSFAHEVDRSTPNILKFCAMGKHLPKIQLCCAKAGHGPQIYTHITLSDCIITSVRVIAPPNGRVIENVGVKYGKINIEVKEQCADGSLGAGICGGWDVKANKEG